MKRAWWAVLLALSCAKTWPRPETSGAWNEALRACRSGDQRACYWKANRLRSSDPVAAAKVHEAACNAGAGQSCNELGFAARDGRGLEKSATRAMALWQRACDLGSKDGCDSLGTGWRDGVGAKVDLGAASVAYEAACAQQDAAGCTNLGLALMEGQGVAKNEARAEALWRQVCATEEILESCRYLGVALVRGAGVRQDIEGGLAMLRRACRLGGAADCLAAGAEMVEHGDAVEALRYVRTSCTWGSGPGCYQLSKLLRAGDAGVAALEEATEAQARACDADVALACERDGGSAP